MNKKALISAILAAAPTAQLTATEIHQIRETAMAPLVAEKAKVFKLPELVMFDDDKYEMTISLVPADARYFKFWDLESHVEAENPGLDLELVVQLKSQNTGKVRNEYLSYFLKRVGEGKFALHQTATTTVVKEVTERDTAYEVITCNTTQTCALNGKDKGLVMIDGDNLSIINPSIVFADSIVWEDLEGKIEKTIVLTREALEDKAKDVVENKGK